MTLRELLAWDSFKAFWWKNSQFQHAIITSASKSNPWCLCSLWFQCHICDGSSKLLWSEEKAVVAESLCPVVALPGATGWWDQTAEPLPLCGLGHPRAVRKPFHLWLAPHPGSALSKQRNLKFAIQSNLKKENKNFIIPCTHLPIAYFECVLNSTFQNWVIPAQRQRWLQYQDMGGGNAAFLPSPSSFSQSSSSWQVPEGKKC